MYAQEILAQVQAEANKRNFELIDRLHLLRKKSEEVQKTKSSSPDIVLGGRYRFTDKDDNCHIKYIDIYYVVPSAYKKGERYMPAQGSDQFLNLTPTKDYCSMLGDRPWQEYHENGGRKILLEKDTWNEVKIADEVEIFEKGIFQRKYPLIKRPYQ